MSKIIEFSDLSVTSLFVSDLRFRIDCLKRLLNSDVSMQIVFSIKPGSKHYRRYFILRHLLHGRLYAYNDSLKIYYSSCDSFDRYVAI